MIDNWGGPLPAEALQRIGIPALEPTMTLVTSRPELAQRKSLQDLVVKLASSAQTERLLATRVQQLLAARRDGKIEAAAALLKLVSESEPLRESLAHQILACVDAPATKAEKALVRAALQALKKSARSSTA